MSTARCPSFVVAALGALLAVSACAGPSSSAETPAPPPPAAETFAIENGCLRLPAPVTFGTGSDTIDVASQPTLDFVQRFLERRADVTLLRVEVHDARTSDEAASQALTERRALAVAKALVAKGIDGKRLIAVGFGSSKPIADGTTPAGRAANQRTEFAPAMLRGRAIGGMPVDGGGRVAGDPSR